MYTFRSVGQYYAIGVAVCIAVDVDRKAKTVKVEYGEVPPLVLKDGTKISFEFFQGK